MNNDDVRALLETVGITSNNVTVRQLQGLHEILSAHLEASSCFRGTYRMEPLKRGEDMKFMTCKADYFDGREAVSFNRDGFIGFAGWASSENVAPILSAVCEWIDCDASD
jgi:hypothetical protein